MLLIDLYWLSLWLEHRETNRLLFILGYIISLLIICGHVD